MNLPHSWHAEWRILRHAEYIYKSSSCLEILRVFDSEVWHLCCYEPLAPLLFLLLYVVLGWSDNFFLCKFYFCSWWVWLCFLGHTGKCHGLVSVYVCVFFCRHKMPCALERTSSCKWSNDMKLPIFLSTKPFKTYVAADSKWNLCLYDCYWFSY